MAVSARPSAVKDVMTTGVHVVGPDTTADTVARTMLENGISALPVIDPSGDPVGMIHRSSLLAAAAAGGSGELRARDMMEELPPMIGRDAGLYAAAALLQGAGADHLLVLDDTGRLAGILSKGDLLRALVLDGSAGT
jgi:CBS domain-containing protein